jgi:hypothetical protein
MSLKRSLAAGVSVLALSTGLPGAVHADPMLPNLVNLDFANYTGSNPKNYFQNVDPVGWTETTGIGTADLVFVDSPTPGGNATNGPNATYQAPTGLPFNYVQADGNPVFESGFNYKVTGLSTGTTYTLSFYQAASQQTGFSGSTTNQWIVALGTVGSTLYAAKSATPGTADDFCGTTCVYEDTDGTASIAASQLMDVPSEGLVNWEFVSVNITADATTDVLSFLAWGDNGNTTNLPPMAFLTGVNAPSGLVGVPEPATLSLFGVGLLGLGAVKRRRRAKAKSAV